MQAQQVFEKVGQGRSKVQYGIEQGRDGVQHRQVDRQQRLDLGGSNIDSIRPQRSQGCLFRIAHGRQLRWLHHLHPRGDLRQAREVDRQGRHQAVFLVGQLHDAFNQVESFEVHCQGRDITATFDVQQVAQHYAGRTGRQLQRLQADDRGARPQSAIGVQDIDRALDQLADADAVGQHLVIACSGQAEVDFQSIEVAEQADVAIDQTIPACGSNGHVASQQATEQQTGNGGLAGIECQHRAADGQRCQRRRECGDRCCLHGQGRARRCTAEQCADAASKTLRHDVAGDYLDRFTFARVDGKYPKAVGIQGQRTAANRQCETVAGQGEAVALGTGGGIAGRGCTSGTIPAPCGGFKRGHVGDALQVAFFQVEPAAVDHHQHERQRHRQRHRRHQANGPPLPGRAAKLHAGRHRALLCRRTAERDIRGCKAV